MSDQHNSRQHAHELRARAAGESDPGRQRYLKGLARAYDELARQRGELEPPEPPATMGRAERRSAAVELRGRNYRSRRSPSGSTAPNNWSATF